LRSNEQATLVSTQSLPLSP